MGGSAGLVSEVREVSGFERVRLEDFGEVSITQDETESLTVEAAPDVLPRILTRVVDGVLVIRVGRDWLERLLSPLFGLSTGSIRYRLTVKTLRGLAISGAGRVSVKELQSDDLTLKLSGAGSMSIDALTAGTLRVDLPGAGRIRVAGQVDEQSVKLSGAGAYAAGELRCRAASVRVAGAGAVTVHAAESLDASLSGMGSVRYHGSPRVTQRITGLGQVVSLGELE